MRLKSILYNLKNNFLLNQWIYRQIQVITPDKVKKHYGSPQSNQGLRLPEGGSGAITLTHISVEVDLKLQSPRTRSLSQSQRS